MPPVMLPKTAKANVTPLRQRTQYTCMATSMAMALQALGQTNCDEDTVNRVMGAQPMKGASWENALACAQHFGMRATLTSPCTVKQLKAWTDQGTPVLIAWNPEGREWSHASLVFDVDDDGNVWVADPNIPDPEETVRVVSRAEFYSKWYEKWPNYLVRRPAMAIEREITVDGRQVQAGKKERRSQKDKGMSRFLKNGPVQPTDKSDATKAMDKAQWEIRKEQGTAGLPGAGMGAGYHKDKSQYDRKKEKRTDREASEHDEKSAVFMGLMTELLKKKAPGQTPPKPTTPPKNFHHPAAPSWRDLKQSNTQPMTTRRDYGVTPMLSTENFQRILKMAEDLPGPVERYVQEVKDANPDYSEGQAWATAWSIYCKYKNPGSEHCQESPSEYFKAAARKIAGMGRRGGDITAKFEKGVSMTVEEVADVVGPEFKEMNENPPESVVKVMEKMQGKTAAKGSDPVWVVRDPTADSEYTDIFYKTTVGDLANLVIGTGSKLWKEENTAIHLKESDAKKDADARMKARGGKTAAKLTTHLEDPKKPGFNLCGEKSYPGTKADGPRDVTCHYCKQAWEKTHGGHTASTHLSLDMFADLLKDSKFEKGESVPLSELPEELQDNVNDPPPSVKKLTDELKGKTAGWAGWNDKMPVQVAFTDNVEVFQNLASAQKKYPELNPDRNSRNFTWGMRGEVGGKPAIRFESWKAYEGFSRSASDLSAFEDLLKEGKFEEGKPADPTENMTDEDAAEWERQNDAHKDEFKGASTPAQRSDDENNAVVENFFHKSAAAPQGAAQKAIMGYLDSHEPGTFALTDMAKTMRGMHFKNIMSAAEALAKNGLVTFDGVLISKATGKTAGVMDLWVGWVEDPDGYMTRFFPPTPRGALKRQLGKIPDGGDWEMMQAGYALKNKLNVVPPGWVSKLPSQDKKDLLSFMEMSPGRTAAGGADIDTIMDFMMNSFMEHHDGDASGVSYLAEISGSEKFAAALAKKWKDVRPDIFTRHGGLQGADKVGRKLIEEVAQKTGVKVASVKVAATGLYGFNKFIEGACVAGVNKLQKAAKKIAAALYAKDNNSPSFLTKHAERGGSRTASMLLKAMESLGPLAQINKTAGRSGTGLYGFPEKTARLGITACNDLHHEAGVIAGDLFARKGADPVKVAGYLASHAKKAKCPYAALLGECAPDAHSVVAKKTAASGMGLWRWHPTHLRWVRERDVSPDTAKEWLGRFQKDEPDGIFAVSAKAPPSKAKGDDSLGVSKESIKSIADGLNKKLATDFLASGCDEGDEIEGNEEVLDLVQ